MITVSDLHRSFESRKVLQGVSFTLPEGSLTGIIGPSGAGKSVLLKIIAGVIHPHAGEVDTAGLAAEQIGFMFQEGALFDSLSTLDNVAFPLLNGNVPVASLPRAMRLTATEKVYAMLERVGLAHAARKMPGQLSGGMRRRVSLARAVVTRPKLALLDDPTYGLDPVASSVIMKLITDLHAEYSPTMVVISQDLRRLLPAVQSIIALFHGRVIFQGTLNELEKSKDTTLTSFVRCRYDLEQGLAA